MSSMSVMGTNKEFILRKYFDELQKYWATQQKLEGKHPSHSNPATFTTTQYSVFLPELRKLNYQSLPLTMTKCCNHSGWSN